MIRLYLDGDSCPVKAEAYRVAKRNGVPVFLASNRRYRVPGWVRLAVVEAGRPGTVDRWILDRIGVGDVVVSGDLRLLQRSIQVGAQALTPRGIRHRFDTIRGAVARRDRSERLRRSGVHTSGPQPMRRSDRARFARELEGVLREPND